MQIVKNQFKQEIARTTTDKIWRTIFRKVTLSLLSPCSNYQKLVRILMSKQ